MAEETDKFVQEMLRKAKEKKETVPQTRTEGVNREEVENIVDELHGLKKKKDNGQ